MAWRLSLSDRPIRRLDVLPGKPVLLAAWTSVPGSSQPATLERVAFHDLSSGAKVDERTLDQPTTTDRPDAWKAYLLTLTAPNQIALPIVRTGRGLLLSGRDGKTRTLIGSGGLTYLRDEQETALAFDGVLPLAACDFDRVGGLVAALERTGRLHLWRGGVRVGMSPTPLAPGDELAAALAVPETGATLYATDGRRLCAIDLTGTIRKQIELHYPAGALACSPDGRLIAVTDLESHVIRVYTAELLVSHQRFAVDLLADAKRTQLMGGTTLAGSAVSAVAITNKGVLAFAVGGMLCATNLTRLKALPTAAVPSPQP